MEFIGVLLQCLEASFNNRVARCILDWMKNESLFSYKKKTGNKKRREKRVKWNEEQGTKNSKLSICLLRVIEKDFKWRKFLKLLRWVSFLFILFLLLFVIYGRWEWKIVIGFKVSWDQDRVIEPPDPMVYFFLCLRGVYWDQRKAPGVQQPTISSFNPLSRRIVYRNKRNFLEPCKSDTSLCTKDDTNSTAKFRVEKKGNRLLKSESHSMTNHKKLYDFGICRR